MTLTEEEINEIIRLKGEGHSDAKTAGKVGCSETTVRKYYREHKGSTPQSTGVGQQVPTPKVQDFTEFKKRGEVMSQINLIKASTRDFAERMKEEYGDADHELWLYVHEEADRIARCCDFVGDRISKVSDVQDIAKEIEEIKKEYTELTNVTLYGERIAKTKAELELLENSVREVKIEYEKVKKDAQTIESERKRIRKLERFLEENKDLVPKRSWLLGEVKKLMGAIDIFQQRISQLSDTYNGIVTLIAEMQNMGWSPSQLANFLADGYNSIMSIQQVKDAYAQYVSENHKLQVENERLLSQMKTMREEFKVAIEKWKEEALNLRQKSSVT